MILHLADNKIRVIKENAFSELKKLMVLYLDENAIRNIEADLSLHTPLRMTIILKDNVLTDTPNLGNLPILSIIFYLGEYKKIYLRRNNLQSIDKNTFSNLNRLDHVDLQSCNLTSLPPGLLSGSPVTFLNLCDNHLTDSDSLVDSIMGSQLSWMSISYNKFIYITPRLCQYFNFVVIYRTGKMFKCD